MLNNPVLYKEMMRMRLRQGKPVQIAIVSAVALAVGYFYWVAASYMLNRHNMANSRDIWAATIGVQFLVIALLTPSATANAISQEREQQTWEMLLQTRLTAKQIIFGKLFARLVPTLAIVLLGLPVTTLCLLTAGRGLNQANYYTAYHPLTPGMFLLANGGLLAMGLFFATFGLYMSMKFKRTLYAMLATYGFVFGVLGIGTVMLTGMLQMFNPNDTYFMERFPLMWINPVYIMGEITSAWRTEYIGYAMIGLIGYASVTAWLLTRLVVRFRSMAIDR